MVNGIASVVGAKHVGARLLRLQGLTLAASLNDPGTELLLEAWKHQQNLAGVEWGEVEKGMTERMKAFHLVPADRIEELLAQAGFSKTRRFFQNFMLGGWIAFKD